MPINNNKPTNNKPIEQKRGRGRPKGSGKKYTSAKRKSLLKSLKKYIDETEIPILNEFCYKNNVLRENLYLWEEFTYTIKNLMYKKQVVLEQKGLKGEINTAMAIFSLKQMGWRDTADITLNQTIGIKKKAKEYSEMTAEELLDELNEKIASDKRGE